ncbi:AAA family ATPase [Mycobacterium colombiense]
MSIERDNMEFSNDPRRQAGSPEVNGHKGNGHVAPADLPADFGKRLRRINERPPGEHSPYPDRPANFVPGSPEAASTVGGLYAAEHGVTRGVLKRETRGYATVAQLGSVSLAHARATGLIDRDHRPSVGEVSQWYAELDPALGWEWEPETPATVADVAGLRAAIKGLDPDRKIALATIDALAADGVPWAEAVRDGARAENAYAALVGDRKQRPMSLTASQLYDRGAPPENITTLPAATTMSLGESARIVRMWDAEDRRHANEQARASEAAKLVAAVEIPGRVNLSTYTPPDTAWLIDGLLPMEGSLGLFAERKAGKTTTVVEMVRSMLNGDEFLGRFATHLPAEARVALLDTEMTPAMLHHEYKKVGMPADDLDRIDLHPLRGRSRLLDLRDEATRARWQELIAPGAVIVVDCLYTVLAAAQVDESSAQVSDIIDGIKALAVQCGAAGLVIVHHLGKDPTKGARGHSSIEGGVDTLATIWLDGPPAADTPRLFSATGRLDVDVPAALLRRGDDYRLTLSASTPKADRARAADRTDDDTAWKLVSDHPGKSVRGLEELPAEIRKLSRSRLRRALERLDGLGYIVNRGTAERPAWHAADRPEDAFTIAADRVD